ncbi:serine hydrolase [Cognatilysobacter segetis]|uniref:serine hydrolase n=1 Tax=Cognatilysobacter segetis TaxID=2492394 RepID=UPI00105D6DEE|nr:serine hydrolase [Lysobacter segetis]
MKKIGCLLLLALWLPCAANAADPAFDAAFDATMARYRLPGLAVGVVEDGKVVYTRTAGELVAGGGAKVDAKTLFKIASNTKAMTAATLARLVDAGKLRWDDPVVKYLPQFRMHDAWVTREMQVRDLLIHNSGLPAGAGDLMLWPEPNTFTRADILHGLGYLKPQYSFRSRYAYDNLLYIVAGEVAAVAGGAPYETLVRREVFEPLGMTRCRVGDWNADAVGNVAQPHMRQGDRNVPVRADGAQVRTSTMEAAGGIRCSLDDMLTWVRAWLSPEGASAGWLSTAQRNAVWAPQMPMPLSARMRDWDGSHVSAYGYGWRLSDVDGVFKVAHTGTLMGMYSAVTMLPDRKVGFVILTNGEGEAARTVLTQALVKHYTAHAPALTVGHYAALLDAEDAGRGASEKAPDTSRRRPARGAELASRLGVYRDPWFGDVSLCDEGDRVRFRAARSPMLDGIVQRVGDRWLVDWNDPSVDAEAWLDFGTSGGPALRLGKVDPQADFSYDFEDLAFERAGACPSPRSPSR